ncbi:MAG: lytic transglycosylase [Rhodobacter sp.]|nr:lytic transglycosylase [Rhodobacter sp.]
MGRFLRALVLLAFAAGCGGGGGEEAPPRNLDDACSIVNQRPNYLKAFKRTERRWGVPVHVQMATIYHESKFDGDARTPLRYVLGVIPMGRQSSAYGYSQALDGTWEEYLDDTGRRRASRDDIRDAADFMGWYMTKTEERTGVPVTDARNQYLAYHEGQTGYLRGSYNAKPWLLRVADRLQERAAMYEQQLRRCRVL